MQHNETLSAAVLAKQTLSCQHQPDGRDNACAVQVPSLPSCCLASVLGHEVRLVACCRPDSTIIMVFPGFKASLSAAGMKPSTLLPCSSLAIQGPYQTEVLLLAEVSCPFLS